jgi:hypothetical protein
MELTKLLLVNNFTVFLEANEPFGPETRVMHEEASDAEEAALRALHHWQNNMEFDPNNTIEELEDGSARILAVLEGHSDVALTRNPSQKLV